MAEDEGVPLDPQLLKVLASDTRRDILRLLRERRMTLSEMARALTLRKATILEHLERLADADLVRRVEDDRVWVYYELTRRGGRMVNPGKTRFVLLLGVGVAALVAGAAIALAAQSLFAPDAAPVPDAALRVEIGRGTTFAGAPLDLDAVVVGTSGPGVSAWLLSEDAKRAADSGAPRVAALRLATSPGAGTPGTGRDTYAYDAASNAAPFLAFTAPPAEPGNYWLYVRDGAGRDNLADLVPLEVAPLDVRVSTDRWWKGVDGPVEVHLSSTRAVEGVVRIASPDAAPTVAVPVEDGVARLPEAVLDALPAGSANLRFLPADGGSEVLLPSLQILDAAAHVAPLGVAEGRAATLHVALGGPPRERALPVRVTLDGDAVAVEAMADRVTLPPLRNGTLELAIGRLAPVRVAVEASLLLELRGQNDTLVLHARGSDGTSAGRAEVLLDGEAAGVLGDDGTFVLPRDERSQTLLVRAEDGRLAVARLEGERLLAARPEAEIDAEGAVLVRNEWDAAFAATVLVHDDLGLRASVYTVLSAFTTQVPLALDPERLRNATPLVLPTADALAPSFEPARSPDVVLVDLRAREGSWTRMQVQDLATEPDDAYDAWKASGGAPFEQIVLRPDTVGGAAATPGAGAFALLAAVAAVAIALRPKRRVR